MSATVVEGNRQSLSSPGSQRFSKMVTALQAKTVVIFQAKISNFPPKSSKVPWKIIDVSKTKDNYTPFQERILCYPTQVLENLSSNFRMIKTGWIRDIGTSSPKCSDTFFV